ncbi:MAG: cation transporter [Clostridia bacterium]|nr:cation transporter [Clostridia bacterium]
MKKTFKLEDLDCPNCAAKLEKAISEIEGVRKASVSFIAQKMIIELDEGDLAAVIKAIPAVAKKAVPDCTVIL